MTLAPGPTPRLSPWELAVAPPPEQWDEWSELDPAAWPERREKHYALIPTICFNCESACGLVAYVDKESERITKFEGNPVHPGSRGRTCAKGPATINQIHDPERILKPLKDSEIFGGDVNPGRQAALFEPLPGFLRRKRVLDRRALSRSSGRR